MFLAYMIVHDGGHKAGTVTLGDLLRIKLQLGTLRRCHALIHVRGETCLTGAL